MKCILVPMAGTSADAATTEAALLVAKKFGAQIEALFARPSVEAPFDMPAGGVDTSTMTKMLAAIREWAEQEEVRARQVFQGLLNRIEAECIDTVTAIFDVVDGAHKDAVIERGAVYDLLVVPHPASGDGDASREIAEAALFHTGRPVLMAPGAPLDGLGRSIVIGWNRSPQAGRAVSNSIPLLKLAERVCICYVDTGAKQGPSPGRLKHYLELHGIEATVTEQVPDRRSIGEMLLEKTRDVGADLLVMGAYSKSRLRERVLGGVTERMFSTADIPVLMAR